MFRAAIPVIVLFCAHCVHAQNPSPEEVQKQAIERRAVEAVIWGMPMVNYDLMYQAAVQNKGNSNQIIYWSRLPSWKNQTLTPNPDAVYLMPFYNTKDVGPMVLEIPPADEGSIVGSLDDCWQTAIEDVGPAGVDKGKGGRYLILPPDYRSWAVLGNSTEYGTWLRSSDVQRILGETLRKDMIVESGDRRSEAKALLQCNAPYAARVKSTGEFISVISRVGFVNEMTTKLVARLGLLNAPAARAQD